MSRRSDLRKESGRDRRRRVGLSDSRSLSGRWAVAELLESRRMLTAAPLISEFMASNSKTLVDSTGANSDWLEIYNPDSQNAINLTGWRLTRGSNSWNFPSMTLGPGEFRVIFADSKAGYIDPNGELHTNTFNLSKDGSSLRLIDNTGAIVSDYYTPYPAQQQDISYGVGQQITETKLVSAGVTARYFIPTSNSLGLSWTDPAFVDSSWAQGVTGLGFAGATPGFAVWNYKSGNTGTIGSIATAQSIVDTPAFQSWVKTENPATINYMTLGASGHFAFDRAFPGLDLGVTQTNWATKANGRIHIPVAGTYTFGVNSDDGFKLSFTGASFSSVAGTGTTLVGGAMIFDGTRGSADSLGAVTFAAAGDYDTNLLYYQGGSSAGVELFAAPGNFTTFAGTTAWRLVGDTTNGGLAVTSYPFTGPTNSVASKVKTDLRSTMQTAIQTVQQQSGDPNADTSLYARISFDAPNLASLQTLTMKMAYDDAYIVYLNGVQIASKNAPASPAWNSQALAARSSELQSSTFENIDITSYLNAATPGHILAAGNVLAIQLLNASPTDGDMLLLPEISQISTTQLGTHFFSTATPAAGNSQSFWQKAPDPVFSATHGIYTQSIPLTLSTASQTVTKLTRKNSTATATVASHGFAVGDLVRISGASPAQYNGDFIITAAAQDTFDYTVSGAPASPATGKISVRRLDKIYYTLDNSDPWKDPIVRTASSLTRASSTATFTSNNHGFINGDKVYITGAVQPEYNGLFVVSGVTQNTFAYTVPGAPATTATGTVVAQRVDRPVTTLAAVGTTVTATVASHGLSNGDLVRIVGATPAEYNGDFIVSGVTTNTFNYTLSAAPSASSATGGMAAFKLGTQYTAPLTIANTTTVRAVVYTNSGNYLPSNVITQTFVFPNDVIQQSATPAGFPGSWDTWPADYQMDPRITTDPAYRNTLVDALKSLPSMSLVSDKTNLFDPTNGIYANTAISLNSNYNGTPMGVPGSVEYFNADGSNDFQINAGLQIYGGVGRSPQYKKHSFRIVFDSTYGPSQLNFPLFGDAGASSFGSIILRSQFNDAWSWAGSTMQLIREAFAPETQLAMGDPSHHTQMVNLYMDGLYWGVYQATERPDADFSATYMGGNSSDWESNNAGFSNGVTNDLPIWNDLMSKTTSGLTSTVYQAGTTGFNTTLYAAGPSATPGFNSITYVANVAVTNLAGAESVIATPSKQTSTSSKTTTTVNFLNTGADGHFATGNNTFPGMANTEVDNFVVETTGSIAIPTAGNWTFGVSGNDGFRLTLTNGTDTYTYSSDTTRTSPADTFSTFNITTAGNYRMRLVYFQNTGGAEIEAYAALGSFSSFAATSTWRLLGDTAGGGLAASIVTPLTTLANAESIIATPGLQAWTQTQVVGSINYLNIGADGHTTASNLLFPGAVSATPMQSFVLKADSTISIPTTGNWTFGVSSDDGFHLQILDGATVVLDSSADGLRTAADTFATFNFTKVGTYTVRLVYFQSTTAGAELELYAAKGSFTSYAASTAWQLVGTNVTTATNTGLLSLAKLVPVTSLSIAESVITPTLKSITALSAAVTAAGATMNTTTKVVTIALPNHGYVVGQRIVISGAAQSVYNGTFTITGVTANTFDYLATATGVTPATGTISVQVYGIARNGGVATIELPGHGFANGDYVTISGAGQTDYNGTFVISNSTADTFTINVLNNPTTPGTGTSILVKKAMQAWASAATTTTAINMLSTGTDGHYGTNAVFPGAISGNAMQNLVMETKTTIGIPTTGPWTFGVSADDGFSLTLTNGTDTFTFNNDGTRTGPADKFATFNITKAGAYRMRVVYFQNSDGGEIELFAAPGTWTTYAQTTTWKQIGDNVNGGIGTSLYDMMSVTTYLANVPVTSLAVAQDVAATASKQISATTEYRNTIDLLNTGAGGHFNGSSAFPGTDPDNPAEIDNFVVKVQASVVIPSAGAWTFGVTCDDGFSLTLLDGLTPLSPTLSHTGTGTSTDYIQTYTFNHTGTYTLQLLYYQNTGEAAVELYAASGTFTSFNTSSFRLVGDTVNGGLSVGSGISPVEMYYELQGQNPDGTPNSSYPVDLDMNNYIDYMLMNLYIGNTDWPSHNFYASSPTGPDSTGYKFFDWDAEWSIGINSTVTQNQLGVSVVAGKPYYYLTASPDFRMRFADRIQQFMFNNGALTAAVSGARYKALADEVQSAITLESARWGDIPTSPAPVPHTPVEWRTERDYLLNTYFPQRSANVLGQFKTAGIFPSIDAPTFAINGVSEYGGKFRPGDTLTATATSGTVYFCLDGSDPRLPGGGLNPSAIHYTAGMVLSQNTQIKARALSGTTWSALADVGFVIDLAPSLRVTEVMYHPADPTTAEATAGYVNQDFEYIEVKNIGVDPVPLAGVSISDGVTFTFPTMTLAPGQYTVVASNSAAFAMRYPGLSSFLAGQYSGHLNNAGERIEIDSPVGGLIQAFTYNNSWYGQTDGGGFSLTIRDPAQDVSLWDSSAGWRISAGTGGTPGSADTLPAPGSVVVNELLVHNGAATDMLEFRNTTAQSIDLSGWFVSDSATSLTKYQIPSGTIIPAGGFLVLTGSGDFGNAANPASHVQFALSAHGGQLYLSSNFAGAPGGYREVTAYGATPAGTPLGIIATSTGVSDLAQEQSATFGAGPTYPGAANGSPLVGPVVINEVMYHPTDPTPAEAAAGFVDANDFEYIELFNRSNTPQSLSSLALGDGAGFSFGWYSDALGTEKSTREQGATATWTAPALAGDTYTVWAHLNLADGDGRRRSLDDLAQYTIATTGGPVSVTIDQNQPLVVGNEVWVNLGDYALSGAASVQLVRGDTGADNWTIADSVKITRAGSPDIVIAQPAVDSFATRSGLTTLAPGAYVVLVSNYAAFDARYHVAANHIPVAGAYTGRLNNAGETVRLYQAGPTDPGVVPFYEIDRLAYGTQGAWPNSPDGTGPSLMRVHPAGFGDDPINWRAGAVNGTPGLSNTPRDKTAPTVPSSLSAQLAITPANRITLNWAASTDPDSFVDHYTIYRNGAAIGTSLTATYADTDIQPATAYTYQVTAVNRDGFESDPSVSISATLPGIRSYSAPDGHIEIVFSQALNSGPATLPANFAINGIAPASIALADNNTRLIITPQTALAPGTAYTVAINHLTMQSGAPLADALQVSFTFAPQGSGYILREFWAGIIGGNVTDLTGNAAYPNSPTSKSYLTSLEAPYNTASSYGTRLRGYIYPPATGAYSFWIAADDSAELWLSTDDTAANAVKISFVTTATGYRTWSSKSAAITLTAGQRYYIQVLQKQNTGNDNLSVRWQLPDGSWENNDQNAPIPGIRLSPYNGLPDITPPTAPQDLRGQLVSSNTQIQLSWTTSAEIESAIAQYNIYRNGALYGTSATPAFLDTSVVAGTRYRYQISAVNSAGFESSLSAPLNMALQGISSIANWAPTSLRLVFSEPLDPAMAQIAANYSIDNGIAVQSAHLEADGLTVTLTISPTAPNITYTLLTSGLRTAGGTALPSTSNTFTLGGAIYREYWTGLNANNTVADLTSSAAYPNSPTGFEYRTAFFESPTNWATNAGERVRGYILPDITGVYNFWIASDDASQLWLSTDANPANKVLIASVAGATASRQWSLNASQKSANISLVAGQMYYIEALMKQGAGAANLAVAWQRPGTTFNTSTGTPIPGNYLLPYIAPTGLITLPLTVGVVPRTTSDTTPGLHGTVSDFTSAVSVNVGGIYYAATNNGDFTWTLPDSAFASALPDGAYPLLISTVDSLGNLDFSSLGNNLIVDTIAPTVQISAIPPFRNSPLSQLQIVFSEPITNFDLDDLRLTVNGSADLLTGAETLTSTDSITWTLGGLSGLDAQAGAYTLTLASASSNIEDAAANPLATGASANWTVDLAAPTITSAVASPTTFNDAAVGSARLSLTVSFNESMNTAIAPIITFPVESPGSALTFNAAASVWLNATTYLAVYNVADTNAALANIDVRVAGAQDLAGNVQTTANLPDQFTIDTRNATISGVSSTLSNGSYKAGAVVPITITFSRPVTVSGDIPALTLATGAVNRSAVYTSGSGTDTLTFSYTVQPGDTSADLDYASTSALSLNGATIRDSALNDAALALPAPGAAGSLGAARNILIDTTAPTALIAGVSPVLRNSSVSQMQITFSEPVANFDLADLHLTRDGGPELLTGNESLTTADSLTWTLGGLSSLNVQEGTYTLALVAASSGIQDSAANALAAGASTAWTIDVAPPTVATLTPGLTTINDSAAGSGTFLLTIAFNEAMNTAIAPTITFPVENPGSALTLNAGLWLNSTTYRAAFDVADTNATLPNVDIRVAGAQDLAGNVQATANLPDQFTIDTRNATVLGASSSLSDGSYKAGAVVPITITFSRSVTVSGGVPALTLATGAINRAALYTSGSGTDTLTFNYTVQPGDTSADLDYASTAALSLNGATIRDSALNDAALALPVPGAAGSLGAARNILIDTTAPVVTVATLVTSNSRPTLTGTVSDGGSGVATVIVTVGGQVLPATVVGGAWSVAVPQPLHGTYNVQVAATDGAGNSGGDSTTNELSVDATVSTTIDDSALSTMLIVRFGDDVSASLTAAALTITPAGSAPIPHEAMSFRWDAATRSGIWTFPGLTRALLPNDNYTIALDPTGITDSAGNPLAGTFTLDTYALAGDADHSRDVGLNDLLRLANHYGLAGVAWADGDFDGDGSVGLNDLLILANNYGLSVPAPAPAIPGAPIASSPIPAPTAPDPAAPDSTAPTAAPPAIPAARPSAAPVIASAPAPVIQPAPSPAAPIPPAVSSPRPPAAAVRPVAVKKPPAPRVIGSTFAQPAPSAKKSPAVSRAATRSTSHSTLPKSAESTASSTHASPALNQSVFHTRKRIVDSVWDG